MSNKLIAEAERQINDLEELGYFRAAQDIRDSMTAAGYPLCEWPEFVIEDILDADFIDC